jgi:cobaltochelatase CobN
MHLLAIPSSTLDDDTKAVDLAQDPADIVVLSAADSELAALARARDGQAPGAPSLRLANFLNLSHSLSVDLYLEQTARHAKLIVLRLLGGASYWPYGLDCLVELAERTGIPLAVLPGDGQPDGELLARSTLGEAHCLALWNYLIEGGPGNATRFLDYAAHLLGVGEAPPAATPLLKAGLYWPDREEAGLPDLRSAWQEGAPVAAITFYRALIQGGNLAPVDALIAALRNQGLNPLPVFVSSLKDPVSAATLQRVFAQERLDIVLNATGFAVAGFASSECDASEPANPFAEFECPVLQVVFSGSSRKRWEETQQGLSARDLAMNVVLPELDGRILTRALSFKSGTALHPLTQCRVPHYEPEPGRISFTARLARAWIHLARTLPAERRVAVVLANYPNRDGRVGNGVGFDTPASTVKLLEALERAGYDCAGFPGDGDTLIRDLLKGPTNRLEKYRRSQVTLSLADYRKHYNDLPEGSRAELEARWGRPEEDPFVRDGAFQLAILRYGSVVVGIQPARGYNIDPKDSYHDPALIPPHGYLAFYIWLREVFGAQAIVHNGKHGNLEWLPGKAVALSQACWPEAALGPVPHIYPFIVNDPGEGTQAKRRAAAVIVDHLTPPLTRAGAYGPLKDLEALIDEYFQASGVDPRRLDLLKRRILELTQSSGLDVDCGIELDEAEEAALSKIDTYVCEMKEAQIRNGLHVLGQAPAGELETDLLVALTRAPRNRGEGPDASLIRALAEDLGLTGFDPLDCEMGAPWRGARPAALSFIDAAPWRSQGDTVERLELLAQALVAEDAKPGDWPKTGQVLRAIFEKIRPSVRACGPSEIGSLLTALDGRFVQPGPSGAPTRGRLDVLPTGRNFYSVDNRALPTPAAWALGEKSARLLIERHVQENGNWPVAFGLSAWGTANMRTGGDDIAQALALIGARPVWDPMSWRVTGIEVIPQAELGRPRVDVTLRVSGFFRDAFPGQIELFDQAVRAVGALHEPEAVNPIAARMGQEARELRAKGVPEDQALRLSGFRVFGSKPGAYGAGLQALIDEGVWAERADLAEAYVAWGGFAYGAGAEGEERRELFVRRLGRIEAVVHNQDNREHDLLDSDDYYQFEGGMTAAVEQHSGVRPQVYHNDHSRPERPVVRTLEEEIGRVVRSRVANPKWIGGVMRHGYKGAFEIAATVDYMFAFSATTGAVKPHHFQLAFDAFLGDRVVRDFLEEANPDALEEIVERFREAIERGLWAPRSNSTHYELAGLAGPASAADREVTA